MEYKVIDIKVISENHSFITGRIRYAHHGTALWRRGLLDVRESAALPITIFTHYPRLQHDRSNHRLRIDFVGVRSANYGSGKYWVEFHHRGWSYDVCL
jgi:hypothetical protein